MKSFFSTESRASLDVSTAHTIVHSWLRCQSKSEELVFRVYDFTYDEADPKQLSKDLTWLGISVDSNELCQSGRLEKYQKIIDVLLSKNMAYGCNCSRQRLSDLAYWQNLENQPYHYDGHCRDRDVDVSTARFIRFKRPDQATIIINDLARGKIETKLPSDPLSHLISDDFIISENDKPSKVITDASDIIDFDITHVNSLHDDIGHSFKLVLLLQSLGANEPEFTHLPRLLGYSGHSLDWGKENVDIKEFRTVGILPDALINYLARLGWSYKDKEIFLLDELINDYRPEKIKRKNPALDQDKLIWINQQHLIRSDNTRLARIISKYYSNHGILISGKPNLEEVIEYQKSRARSLIDLAKICLVFYQRKFETGAIAYQQNPKNKHILQTVKMKLDGIEVWDKQNCHSAIKNTADELGVSFGSIAKPLRLALTAGVPTPELDTTINLLGKQRCLERISYSIASDM